MLPKSFGRYQILEEIGRGGMARVYMAVDPTFRRQVAIKLLPPHYLENPLLRARFEREARLIATIEHPAIVPVYDFGEQDGQLYLVMRYMPGGSLATKIRQGPFTLAQATELLTPLTQALDAVHGRGIVHRDLKPGNILMDAFRNPALSDFGIAHLSEATIELTGEAIIGTPAYMSPEQVRGEAALDGRSDVYALGIILFEMLTGRTPYQAATPMSMAMRHLTEPVPEIRSLQLTLPEGLQMVVDRALAKERDDRYDRASDLSFDLRALVESYGEKTPGVTENLRSFDQPVDSSGKSADITNSSSSLDGKMASAAATEVEAASGALLGDSTAQVVATNPSEIVTLAGKGPASPVSHPPEPEKLPGRPRFRLKSLAGLGGLALFWGICALGTIIYFGVRTLLSGGIAPTQANVQLTNSPLILVVGSQTPEAALEPASVTQTAASTTPTPNPLAASLSPTLEPTLVTTPIFFDDFSSPANGWPQGDQAGGGYSYTDGAYVIEVLENGALFWAAPEGSFSDAGLSVEAARMTGDQGYYGLLCRIQDAENYYYFIVRPDGYFTIGKYEAGEFFSLTPGGWTFKQAIMAGDAANHLEAECIGNRLQLSVNGSILGEASDNTFDSGKPGLVAAALDDLGFQARFDDFAIYTLDP